MSNVYSVGQINQYIQNMFSQDFMLNKISICGEVSNCKYHTSGHIYFSLKDESGSLACVMFAGQRKGLAFSMKNGDRVVVSGSVDVYTRDGRYQLYAKQIRLEGAGLLYERFIALKQELEEAGMFSEEYKRSIPSYATRIGIVTAPTGAAIQDIKNISLRRNPYVQLILYPALVQGVGAKESIVEGIHKLDAFGVDVIIIGRGGGSMEDLWAFNEEEVARAIFQCETPVISAVGHETDFSISDYVADMRAPTPSAAAELAVFDISLWMEQLQERKNRMDYSMNNQLFIWKQRVETARTRLYYLSPQSQIREKRMYLLQAEEKLVNFMEQKMLTYKHKMSLYAQRLEGVSPIQKLQQGFAYVEDEQGQNIRSIEGIQKDDKLRIRMQDGNVWAKVEEIE